jgi:hypothetical protein
MALQSMIQKFFDPNDPSTWGVDQGNAPQSSAQVPDAPAAQGGFYNAQPETPAPGSIAAAYSGPAQPQQTPSFDDFKAQNPNAANAYMPPRPVTPFDRPTDAATGKPMTADQVRASSDPNVNTWSNRHTGLRRGLADVFAGLTEYAGDRSGHPGQGVAMVENMNAEDQAQRQYDANAPKLRAAADQQAYSANLGNQQRAGDIARNTADTNLTNQQTENLKLNPPGKAQFLKEFADRVGAGEDDPKALFGEYAARAPYAHVTREDLINVLNTTPIHPPAAKIGPQGIAEPLKYGGRIWNGTEPDAPEEVKRAFTTAKPVEATIHQNKLQEQAASRSNIVLKNDLQNGPLGKIDIPQGVSGEAALQNLDPGTAAAVRMIGDGKADFSTFTSRMQPQAKTNLAALVHAYNPDFDQATFAVRKGVQEDLTSGGKSNTILAYNTSLKHLDSFLKVAAKLGNGDFTPMNELSQAIGLKFGSDASTNFALARDFFSGEVGKAAAGTTATQAERQEISDKISRASSWTQLQGAAATAKDFLEGKRSAMQHQAEQGLKGKADFGDANNSPNAPAPQTHVFSLGAWKKANPNGDVNAAKVAAQAQGYQVAQ